MAYPTLVFSSKVMTESRKGQAGWAKWADLAIQRDFDTLNGDLPHTSMLLKSKALPQNSAVRKDHFPLGLKAADRVSLA